MLHYDSAFRLKATHDMLSEKQYALQHTRADEKNTYAVG